MSLRELKEKDAEGMLEWMNDPEIQKTFAFQKTKLRRKTC